MAAAETTTMTRLVSNVRQALMRDGYVNLGRDVSDDEILSMAAGVTDPRDFDRILEVDPDE